MTHPRILKIARMGHPILGKKANDVPFCNGAAPWSGETLQSIADMRATFQDLYPITGITAPQVFISERIVLYGILKSRSRGTLNADIPLTVMINPQIDILSQETTLDWEGCLSIPGLLGEVPRYKHIRVRYRTEKGDHVIQEASDFHARVLQHECDHLDGILYPERMVDLRRFSFEEEALKYLYEKDPSSSAL